MKIGVVVPVLNSFQMAVDALASVRTKYDWEPFIIPNYRENNCISKSWNVGINRALEKWCDYVLVINDDILIAPGTVDKLVEYMGHRSPTNRENVVLATGQDIKGITANAEDTLTMEDSDSKLTTEGPNFSCFMLDADTIESIGWFDEKFVPGYFEDNDYHRRILLADKKAVCLTSAPFYHYGSQTQNHNNEKVVTPRQFITNRQYYVEKWGGEPGSEQFSVPFNRKVTFTQIDDEFLGIPTE